MDNNKKQELKNKIEEAVKNRLNKFKKQDKEEKEEERCVEPFVLLDPELCDFNELCEIHEFTNLSDIVNPEACPSVDGLDADGDVAYIPINEVELDQEELDRLNDLTRNIKAVDELMVIPCEVNGQERLLVDTANCNIRPIPILGLFVVAPVNVEVIKIDLDANTQSDEEIEVHLLINNEDGSMVHALFDMATLVNTGLVSLVSIVEGDSLKISPVEFRGMTAPVSFAEFKKLVEVKGEEE